MLNSKVKEYLDNLEIELKVLKSLNGELHIARCMIDILKQNRSYKPTKEDQAEHIAFDFAVIHQNTDEQRTYYGPMSGISYTDKRASDPPCIQAIDQDMLVYWGKRAKESKNPILSSRYADLVVDFSLKTLGEKADVDLLRVVIDSNIIICEKSLMMPFDCKTRAKRALVLAITINDKKRIAKIKDTIIKLEKNIARDDMPGLWGFAFQWLLLDFAKKVTLKNREVNQLISSIEQRLKRASGDPLVAGDTVRLLAKYYSRKNDEENLMRVLNILESSLKTSKQPNSDAFSKTFDYECLHELYESFANRFPKAQKASKRLLQEIGQINQGELPWQKLSFEIEIEKKEVNDQLQAIFGKNQNNDLELVMIRIAFSHLPKKTTIEDALKNDLKDNPVQFSLPHRILSDDGVTVAKFPSSKRGDDSHFEFYASQHFSLLPSSLLLPFTMDELRKRFTKVKIIEYYEKCLVFQNNDKDYLNRAITAYWDKDYLISSHFFIPLIESGIRILVQNCGGLAWKQNKSKGYDRLSLGALLRDMQIGKFFAKIDINILFYFKFILTEKLGLNLRNDFAHGLEKEKFSLRVVSDRLFHILILLSLAKKENGKIVSGFS